MDKSIFLTIINKNQEIIDLIQKRINELYPEAFKDCNFAEIDILKLQQMYYLQRKVSLENIISKSGD